MLNLKPGFHQLEQVADLLYPEGPGVEGGAVHPLKAARKSSYLHEAIPINKLGIGRVQEDIHKQAYGVQFMLWGGSKTLLHAPV